MLTKYKYCIESNCATYKKEKNNLLQETDSILDTSSEIETFLDNCSKNCDKINFINNTQIIPNPDEDVYNEVTKAVNDNDGYCCCAIEHTPDVKCMCKEFRNTLELGECHCGRFIKILKK